MAPTSVAAAVQGDERQLRATAPSEQPLEQPLSLFVLLLVMLLLLLLLLLLFNCYC